MLGKPYNTNYVTCSAQVILTMSYNGVMYCIKLLLKWCYVLYQAIFN